MATFTVSTPVLLGEQRTTTSSVGDTRSQGTTPSWDGPWLITTRSTATPTPLVAGPGSITQRKTWFAHSGIWLDTNRRRVFVCILRQPRWIQTYHKMKPSNFYLRANLLQNIYHKYDVYFPVIIFRKVVYVSVSVAYCVEDLLSRWFRLKMLG